MSYEAGQRIPHLSGSYGKRNLRRMPPMRADAAIIDAGGLAAAEATLEKQHRGAPERHVKSGRAAGRAAADDRGIVRLPKNTIAALDHSTACPAVAVAQTGKGFNGGGVRRHPMPVTDQPTPTAMKACAFREHLPNRHT